MSVLAAPQYSPSCFITNTQLSMTRAHNKTLESIQYTRGTLRLLDQRKVPFETVFDEILTVEDICAAIKEMRVRGAPAIAVSAALAIAVAAEREAKKEGNAWNSAEDARRFVLESCDTVMTARPTAVNLSKTLTQLKRDIEAATVSTATATVEVCVSLAEKIYAEDVAYNEGIMRHGAPHIVRRVKKAKVSVLTICNTGALATSRYGTALGVVRQLFYGGNLEQLYACETRPWNQGARLTVYECVQENIPCTLICDSAAPALMRSRTIDAVIVGADRICKNGDTVNKIGTYSLAVAAAHHGIPFFVAAPTTTLDPLTADGDGVVIEERETMEITHNMSTRQRVVAEGPSLHIWNPVFDVTPAELITGGIITELGVVPPSATAPFFDISRIVDAF
ncbi:translation initiation factor 2 subunit [Trypanosoma rangeli]|uniref:Methylthioribose-1-phosphate isomerase n=1 Tax=Trypanosoma rangeli TaxID=5698 RepID=A0A3R7RI50_TRYRA|nr:translation initiation factor 2 subunit [Trypanosoma rangeli]RNF03057.1 translation initiation factor 2 subunit [Trypanosoma rangeli]|eukprot:RNF03057.1 translation initiation factor 2 subunit [Trypanosoma rangeli]